MSVDNFSGSLDVEDAAIHELIADWFHETRWYTLLPSVELSRLSEASLQRLPYLSRSGVSCDYRKGGVVRLEESGEGLGAEHTQVVLHFQHMGFCV